MTAESDIAARLAAQGFGTVGTNIFVNYKPPTPDNLIVVSGYAGQAPERTHDTSGNARPSVQVWVRNTSAANGRTIIGNIWNNLDGLSNITLSSTFYPAIDAISSPESTGKDENGRQEYATNFSTIQRR
jgi:hypothetical protein